MSFAEALNAVAQSTRAALAEDGEEAESSRGGSSRSGGDATATKKRKFVEAAGRLETVRRKAIRALIKSELKGAIGRTMKAKALRKVVLAKLQSARDADAGTDTASGIWPEKKELKALFQSELENAERDMKIAVTGKSVSYVSKINGVSSFGFPSA